jgi:uncharacterized protein (DUF4415 family)
MNVNRKMSNLFPGSAVRNTDNKIEQNNNIDSDVNINNNGNIITKKKKETKVTEEIHGLLKKENNDKKVVGFYLDKDIREAFKTVLEKNPPRGFQSKLANKIFRDFLKENDIL